jgi:predicted SprT family Zn-dependent metalloprotease
VGRMTGIPEPLRSRARTWEELWGLPGLAESVTVEFSRRFRSSLGRCRPVEGRIRLAAHLANGRRDLLEEVLCHELAHVAVHRLYRRRAKPHGPEWKRLLVKAGFEPRVRFPPEEGGFPSGPARRRARYEHRCPVCQVMRMAGRPVRNWRCVECLRAGLSGDLVITRMPVGTGGGGGDRGEKGGPGGSP